MGDGAAPWTASAAGGAEWCSGCYVTVTSEGCPQLHLSLCLCHVFCQPVYLGGTLFSGCDTRGLCVTASGICEWAKGFVCQFVLTPVVIEWILVLLNWELYFSALSKTSKKWYVNNSVVSLAIWLSSAALFFVNFKFGVPTNDACTVEIHNPFALWKGISQVLKQFSEIFFSSIFRQWIVLFVLVSLFYFGKDSCATWKAKLWYFMNTLYIFFYLAKPCNLFCAVYFIANLLCLVLIRDTPGS